MTRRPDIPLSEHRITAWPSPTPPSPRLPDPIPRVIRYVQVALAVMIAVLCINGLVSFEKYLLDNGLTYGTAYVWALALAAVAVSSPSPITSLPQPWIHSKPKPHKNHKLPIPTNSPPSSKQAIYTPLPLMYRNPTSNRLIFETLTVPVWLFAAAFLTAQSAIVMNKNCSDCVYIHGTGPNCGVAAAAFGWVEM